MANENMGIDIKTLAGSIADDIKTLHEKLSDTGESRDLMDIDFSAFKPETMVGVLKHALQPLNAKAKEVARKNEKDVEEIRDGIENSIKIRKDKLTSDLKKLKRTAPKDDDEAKMIMDHISSNLDLNTRRLSELQIEREKETIKPRSVRVNNTNVETGKKQGRTPA